MQPSTGLACVRHGKRMRTCPAKGSVASMASPNMVSLTPRIRSIRYREIKEPITTHRLRLNFSSTNFPQSCSTILCCCEAPVPWCGSRAVTHCVQGYFADTWETRRCARANRTPQMVFGWRASITRSWLRSLEHWDLDGKGSKETQNESTDCMQRNCCYDKTCSGSKAYYT